MNQNLFSIERAKQTLGGLWLPLNIIACVCATTLLLITIYRIYKLKKEIKNDRTSKINREINK